MTNFSIIQSRYEKHLNNLKRFSIGNRVDGEDLQQEALLQLHKICSKHKDIRHITYAFSYRLSNLVIEAYRHERRLKRDYKLEQGLGEMDTLIYENDGVERVETIDALRYALSKLTTNSLLFLRTIMPNAEYVMTPNGVCMAKVMRLTGFNYKTVRRCMYEIKRKFQAALDGETELR